MKVKFADGWFAPSPRVKVDSLRYRSGKRYQAGEYEIPDDLFDDLPPSAIILEPPKKMLTDKTFVPIKKAEIVAQLRETLDSRSLDQIHEAHVVADETRKEARKAILVKARAVRARNKAERDAAAKAEPVAAQ